MAAANQTVSVDIGQSTLINLMEIVLGIHWWAV